MFHKNILFISITLLSVAKVMIFQFLANKAHKLLIIRNIFTSLVIMADAKATKLSDDLLVRARNVVPPLTNTLHKGQAGRIGVIGGSFEYTGAPYFASMASMRVGADAVHVFCARDAATPIKSYSPELMVHPVLDDPTDPVKLIEPWLERLHVVVIGPGLGRNEKILETVTQLIDLCKTLKKPLVIDADGLFLVSQNVSVLADYPGVILTPNAVEFTRIFTDDGPDMAAKFKIFGPDVTVLKKGFSDLIYSSKNEKNDYDQITGGGTRRCSGQGDILSGTLAVFYNWAIACEDPDAAKVASYGASYFVKKLNQYTYQSKGRSMVASDMLQNIHNVFERDFENKQTKQ